MLSILRDKALEEKDMGLHLVDRPLGQQHSLEESSIIPEAEVEVDQVDQEVSLTLIPQMEEKDHKILTLYKEGHWNKTLTHLDNQEIPQNICCKDKGKARSKIQKF
ncbi:hypothetical protein GY45DRAFT_1376515 [Cubamyces sp. BRFM 1775]|nr:hypothetical protein GY45DRAFT_1376515 [Cubamyces sp. BRFM 1775]